MGQIVSSAAKPKRCNLNQLSQVPTPAAGEHILVSSDNSMNAAGQGNFDAYVVGDGTTAATALPLHKINEEAEMLAEFGFPHYVFSVLNISSYANSINNSISILSDRSIEAGSVIDGLKFYANTSGRGCLFLISTDLVCEKVFTFSYQSGWNEIPISFKVEKDVRIGINNLNIPYAQRKTGDVVFSANGLVTMSPYVPTEGASVTTSKMYSGTFAIPLQVKIESDLYAQITINKENIEELDEELNGLLNNVKEEVTKPTFYSDTSLYGNTINGISCVSDIRIPAGSYINEVRFLSSGASSAGSIFFIRLSDNQCVFKKAVSNIQQGLNVVELGYTAEYDVRLGAYGLNALYTNSGVADEYAYSLGVNNTSPLSPNVGDTVTINPLYTANKFAIAIQWDCPTNDIGASLINLDNRVSALETPVFREHPAFVSFIDDDTGMYVPEIWGSILQQAPIRMGFACVTGFMSGAETPAEVYTPMTMSELRELYNAGHEVYSHSYSHPAFYSASTTLAMIEEQCRKSKQWMEENFPRNADIIVYPGGLGPYETGKQAVVSQFYRFGIDTTNGINIAPMPNPYNVLRYNADTLTLDELKSHVDAAISNNAHLVLMNHAYQLNLDKENQIAKMVALIQYIKTTSAEILPFAEAIRRIYGWDYHFQSK